MQNCVMGCIAHVGIIYRTTTSISQKCWINKVIKQMDASFTKTSKILILIRLWNVKDLYYNL